MPEVFSDLDLYALAPSRDAESINSFLDAYTDRAVIEDRGNEELLLYAPEADDDELLIVHTLTDIIAAGLSSSGRWFWLTFPTTLAGPDEASLSFTEDGHLFFGLHYCHARAMATSAERVEESMEEGHARLNRHAAIAEQTLLVLMEHLDCPIGVVLAESGPPDFFDVPPSHLSALRRVERRAGNQWCISREFVTLPNERT